ncbi:hypothetical protein LTR10_014675 [Elasticomyces elasticus]|uniref:Uncharacterized protein n=1 Tax=Exophiala sideris TaxID=1016849 RepID=A0ABR0J7I7_9EURO|nr:hypothetical protein LTR10_014675 [Elasticomyces elasticus]KAK5029320.1 hypothetical protein LTS07_005782 [Exophiala sideris]KAK5036986.1 hypothetical protein LTR13_005366 [Exophiala sideris]KAK5057950.1 hypothetical protein LTR69_006947 [Exophiala sideris]KAK5181909.1 hypothetical protein LTR44_005510 [Eurotiomycetes sp. CCFEE 6388]
MPYPQPKSTLSIAACPTIQSQDHDMYPDDPDPFLGTDNSDPRYYERYPTRQWLSNMLVFPQLSSDVFIVLDCFDEELAGPNDRANITFLLDDDYEWTRYLVLFAGYPEPPIVPGKLSNKLMSVLEELSSSNRFYAREGLITSGILRDKLEKEVRFDNDLGVRCFGNDGKDFIHVSPLPASATAVS